MTIKILKFNAPEEKHSDSADEERATPIHTEGQNTTASVNKDEESTFQDDADEEDEVAGSDAALAPALSPPEAEKKSASTSLFGNIFGGPKADAQVEDSASVAKGAADYDIEPRDIALIPESRTVNTDSEQDDYQDTEVVAFNAPEEKHSDSEAEVGHGPANTDSEYYCIDQYRRGS